MEPASTRPSIGGATTVLRSASLDDLRIRHPGGRRSGVDLVRRDTAHRPQRVACTSYGDRRIATAVLLPRDHDGSPLPVLLDPYGGPARAVRACIATRFLVSQWFADQGFAVVVIDGRGTPGRGTEWERAVHLDLATPIARRPGRGVCTPPPKSIPLDLGRVAIRGWSFGGYLAALAVLRRPDVFHAAIAGAPVTEWRLYDTHYTERYLGDPTVDDTAYANRRCCRWPQRSPARCC